MLFNEFAQGASAPSIGIGHVFNNVDLKKTTKNEIDQIKRHIYDSKVAIFKNQTLDTAEFNQLSYAFGEPVPYLQENYHHPDYPLIFVSANVELGGKPVGVPRTGGYWHSDTAFLKEPIPLTILYPQVVPQDSLRTTMFIDLEHAYQAMPNKLKQVLDNVEFIHSGRSKYKVRPEDAGLDISEILAMIDSAQPPVKHPAVITHPVTGRKSLYATRGFTIGVANKTTEESNALLSEVFEFIEQDQFITSFQWELGDLIIWDNRCLAHKAGRHQVDGMQPSEALVREEETMVFRIIAKDNYPLSA